MTDEIDDTENEDTFAAAMPIFTMTSTHVDHAKKALTSLIDSGRLNRRDERKARNVLENKRRLQRFAATAALAMQQSYEDAGYAAGEFGSFIDVLDNWITFFLENQDRIMQLIEAFMSIISMFFVI